MKSIISRIKQIEAEQMRRQTSKLAAYNSGGKVHFKQLEFHKCQKRNRWVFGGNRSGKTECGAVETVWLARGSHPFKKCKDNISCWVVSLSTQVQRDVAQQKILSYLDKSWITEIVMLSGSKGSAEYGVIDYIIIKNVFGGYSRIGFKSCEAGREKFQGTSLDFVWFDEEPPQDIYEECQMRILDRQGEIFATMTPLKGQTWVYEEIYLNAKNNPQVWYITMEWGDNPYLLVEETNQMSQSLSKDSLRSRRYGEFSSSCGLVYNEFDVNLHVIKPFFIPPNWHDTMSIDPGLNNPLSCHWYATDGDGVVYVIAEHYEAGRDIVYHAQKIKDICKRINWQGGKGGRLSALIDSAANAQTLAASKSVAELFIDQGIHVNTKVNKDIFSGINRVKSFLMPLSGNPRLYIFDSCENLIKEIKSYRWAEDDKPKKADDHALDELRYYISSKPEPSGFEQKKSVIQLDKEKLAKKVLRHNKRL